MKKGILLVVSGPSGVGKGTVIKQVLAAREHMYYSVSATTREMREGEVDGRDYDFMKKEDFLAMKAENGFLENAEFCGNYYGTPRKRVIEKLEKGIDVLLEIEVQGAMQVRASFPEAVLVFIAPPSLAELRRRLVDRKTETAEVIEKRLSTAIKEFACIDKYAYIVVNDIAENAAVHLSQIIESEKLRTERNMEYVKENLLL
ncbi:MAG: guanylate kinase [Clostridia bacterium]|nr:guanylate kinase [Clostridia bacterium]